MNFSGVVTRTIQRDITAKTAAWSGQLIPGSSAQVFAGPFSTLVLIDAEIQSLPVIDCAVSSLPVVYVESITMPEIDYVVRKIQPVNAAARELTLKIYKSLAA